MSYQLDAGASQSEGKDPAQDILMNMDDVVGPAPDASAQRACHGWDARLAGVPQVKPVTLREIRGQPPLPSANQKELKLEPFRLETLKGHQACQPGFHRLTIEVFDYMKDANHHLERARNGEAKIGARSSEIRVPWLTLQGPHANRSKRRWQTTGRNDGTVQFSP